jgi:DNA ligase (NAD+)
MSEPQKNRQVTNMDQKQNEDKILRMKELHRQLLAASRAYYQESREIMSNFEYDRLYDELLELEKETGTVLAGSPTQKVGYEVLSELPKEAHEAPMLSLDKTKEVPVLQEWLGSQKGLLSWKLDGLTIVLTYEGGELVKAVTRGNGEIGEVITNNAKVFANVPLRIPYQGQLILRGEAVIKYSDFARINEEIEDVDAKYKNPRNLCSGSVRQLNNEITAKRSVNFEAFMLVQAVAAENAGAAEDAATVGMPDDGTDHGRFHNSRREQFEWLKTQGFDVVEYKEVNVAALPDAVAEFAEAIQSYDIPSDGLVLLMDDIAYGDALGRTAKFPRNSIAFKWADEILETTLREIEWSASRTGLINPVAIFDPVELEGTTVSRASVHNISIMEAMELGVGDTITVYKANMIIPQIAENLTRSGNIVIPKICPVCGGETQIRQMNDVKSLYCMNPDCQAKKIKSFSLLVSRDALNIDGLSEATLEKFIAAGFIHSYADMFHLDRHKEAIVSMEGFGEKSYENLMAAVKKASHTNLVRVVYGIGVAGIGLANAKMLCRAFGYDFDKMRHATAEELTAVDGIGAVLADAWIAYFASEKNREAVDGLLAELTIENEAENTEADIFAGMTFVITGSVQHFASRKELQAFIEARGGKATSSVTAKTTYLINNDVTSNSSKNKKAKELGIPIISEQDFLNMMGGENNAD